MPKASVLILLEPSLRQLDQFGGCLPAAGRDRFLLEFGCDQIVKNIALPRFEPHLLDRFTDLVERQVMHRPRLGDDVLFDHQAAHVVGAEQHASWPIFSPCVTQLL